MTWRARFTLLGIALLAGLALNILGGLVWQPPVPKCPNCAVLTHPYGGCNEAVQGGWICP